MGSHYTGPPIHSFFFFLINLVQYCKCYYCYYNVAVMLLVRLLVGSRMPLVVKFWGSQNLYMYI